VLTYAEIHYRPRFVPSLIYRKQPEIVFDAPTRVDPGRAIPLFLIIKDADSFPVSLMEVVVHAVYESGAERVARFPFGGLVVREGIWWDSFNIVPEFSGMVRLVPYLRFVREGRPATVVADNYPGTSKSPLVVQVSTSALPGERGWYHGDIHCHSFHTSDQVEFGAPMEALALAGFSMGLDWVAVTDHSYDLDDTADDYSERDPANGKWRAMRSVAELLQRTFTVIPGEEVTCRTAEGRNCHMLALDSECFISGSGDGGENGLNTETEYSIGEAVEMCLRCGGVACAAHPLETVPVLERLVLNRGEWTFDDLETPGVSALQIHNGVRDRGFRKGMENWRRLLLSGRKVYAYGGSDAHGDLNRARRLGFPFLSVTETRDHTFGCVRTVVRAGSERKDDICDALRNGHAVVSEGPFVDLPVVSGGMTGGPGDTLPGGDLKVRVSLYSSPEFGPLGKVTVFAGVRGETSERILVSSESFESGFSHSLHLDYRRRGAGYIRAECETGTGRLCFTNPVWME